MFRLLIVVLLFFFFPDTACARLGESIQENKARYGYPVKDPHNTSNPILKNSEVKTYDYQGWRIRVAFLNNHAVRIVYAKMATAGATPRILDDEALAILRGEAHGGKWQKIKRGSVLFGAYSGNKVLDTFKSVVYGKPTGNRIFDTATHRWVNSNNLIAYISADGMRLIVDAPEAAMWENAIKQGKEEQRKDGIPKF